MSIGIGGISRMIVTTRTISHWEAADSAGGGGEGNCLNQNKSAPTDVSGRGDTDGVD